MEKIRVLVVGLGKIGRNVLQMLPEYPDMELAGIVTRRQLEVAKEFNTTAVYKLDVPEIYRGCGADVAIMCGGSKNDLPKQTPFFATHFNVVDSFDTHGHIGPYIEEGTGQPMLGHLRTVDIICRETKHTGHIGIGWDPGSFSLMRAFFNACLADCKVYAFYGLTEKGGLSLGHTNALLGIPGIVDARQYTHAKPEAIELVRQGGQPDLSDRDKHRRECKIVIADGADEKAITEAIVNMPLYYEPYDTTVKVVSQAELDSEKADLSHDGLVIATGTAGYMEFKNVWVSNPMATAGFLLAYARATHRANLAGHYGCFTAPDTPVADLLLDCETKVSLI